MLLQMLVTRRTVCFPKTSVWLDEGLFERSWRGVQLRSVVCTDPRILSYNSLFSLSAWHRNSSGQLPLGAYCSFLSPDLKDCGWENVERKGGASGHPMWIKSVVDGQHVAKANFSASDGFTSHAVFKSPSFPPIPLYHSLYESALFNSCLVSLDISFSIFFTR